MCRKFTAKINVLTFEDIGFRETCYECVNLNHLRILYVLHFQYLLVYRNTKCLDVTGVSLIAYVIHVFDCIWDSFL